VTLLKLDIDSKEGALLHVATHMIERNLTEVRSILIGLGDFKAHMTVMGTCNHARNALLMRNGLPQPLPEGADSWVSCRGGGRYSSLPRLRVISSGLPPTGTHRLKSHHLRSRAGHRDGYGTLRTGSRLSHALGLTSYIGLF
jgi:hypothetical protein